MIRKFVDAARGRALGLKPGISTGTRVKVGSITLARPAEGSRLILADNARLYDGVGIYLDGEGSAVSVGRRTYINRRSELICMDSIEIGDDCAISWDVTITDTDYHQIVGGGPRHSAVKIGDHVWVGSGATILKGVTVGSGAVIAANATVARDVPANTLVAGTPAKPIREVQWEL